jgi:hypothetical protein
VFDYLDSKYNSLLEKTITLTDKYFLNKMKKHREKRQYSLFAAVYFATIRAPFAHFSHIKKLKWTPKIK